MSTQDWIDTGMKGVVWTRNCGEARTKRPPLSASGEVDLIVVGAGYCGLGAALSAAKAGLKVAVLETGTIGVGASGRNGGYAVPHFPGALRPSAVEAMLGREKGQALCELVMTGPDRLAELVRHYDIKSDYQQNGWMQPAHSEKAMVSVRAVYQDWIALGAPVEWLSAEAFKAETGAHGYLGSWRNPSGAIVNPYAQALGLARAAEMEGATIFEETRVVSVTQPGTGRPVVTCCVGNRTFQVQANKVLIATNAYTDDLAPRLKSSILNVRLWHGATKPLTAELREQVMPNNNCFTDLRKSGGFARLDQEGRLITGGAVFAAAPDPVRYGLHHGIKRMQLLFPQLKGIDFAFDDYWEGYGALTEEYIPRVQRLYPDVFSVLGFSTRGVNLAPNTGLVMGEFLAGKRDLGSVPLEVHEGVKTITFAGFKCAVGRQMFPLYQLKDRLGLT